jgi:hypothetical protein
MYGGKTTPTEERATAQENKEAVLRRESNQSLKMELSEVVQVKEKAVFELKVWTR